MKGKERIYLIGEIYWVKLAGEGSVQSGWHPGIIVQNNVGNTYSNTIAVVPLTSRNKRLLPTHVKISSGQFGLLKDSTAQCEGQRPVDKSQIGAYIGTVDSNIMSQIAEACLVNTPYLNYLSKSEMDYA